VSVITLGWLGSSAPVGTPQQRAERKPWLTRQRCRRRVESRRAHPGARAARRYGRRDRRQHGRTRCRCPRALARAVAVRSGKGLRAESTESELGPVGPDDQRGIRRSDADPSRGQGRHAPARPARPARRRPRQCDCGVGARVRPLPHRPCHPRPQRGLAADVRDPPVPSYCRSAQHSGPSAGPEACSPRPASTTAGRRESRANPPTTTPDALPAATPIPNPAKTPPTQQARQSHHRKKTRPPTPKPIPKPPDPSRTVASQPRCK